MKYFIITIDTEGDNLWQWKYGDEITTNNVSYLNRFQKLCDNYGFMPVWLTNYEMINDKDYVDFISDVVFKHKGEIGMHLHAWNTPPEYKFAQKRQGNIGAPYLIEYPIEIMEQKIEYMTQLIKERTGVKPISHRAGRWATNQAYFDMLIKYGYKIDCSVTPHVNWAKNVGYSVGSKGSDYSKFSEEPYFIESSSQDGNILEVPVSCKILHSLSPKRITSAKDLARAMKNTLLGQVVWVRPGAYSLNRISELIDIYDNDASQYVMFMLHSSEMMPGCSPNFPSVNSIEKLYEDLKCMFDIISGKYVGCTLSNFYNNFPKMKAEGHCNNEEKTWKTI